MTAYLIVWNESKTEGVVFRNTPGDSGEEDARHAAGVRTINPCSTLADSFLESYGFDDACFIQEIDINIQEAKPAEDF